MTYPVTQANHHAPDPTRPEADDVDEYERLGYSGYVIAYRKRYNGDSPSPKLISALSKATKRRHPFAHALKQVVEALT